MNPRKLRIAIVVAVTAAVSLPLIAQVSGRRGAIARADRPKALAPDSAGDLNPVAAPEPTTLPTTGPAVDPAKVVLTVGDEKITAGEFNRFLAEIPPQQAAKILARPDGRRRIADEIVTLKIVSDEVQHRMAEGSGKERLTFQQAMVQALTNQLASDGAESQKFFNDHRGYFDQLKAHHILIATDDSVVPGKKLSDSAAKAKATDIKKRLDAGADFAKLAKEESDDVSSGAEGGDLGAVYRGMMVPPFEQALFGLKKGEVSEPVRTPFGYHVIQLIDKVPSTYDNVRQQVVQRRFELLLDELRRKEPAVLDETYFGKKPAAPATQPTTKPATKPAAEAESVPASKTRSK